MRWASAALVLPLALAACGGGDDEVVIEATPAAVAEAGAATLDAGTARIEISMSMDLSALGLGAADPIELTGTGVVDFAGHRMSMDIELGPMLEALGDEVPAEAATLFDEPMHQVLDGSVLYQCAEFYAVLGGSDCIRMDFAELLGEAAASQMGSMGGGADPSVLLQSLGGAENAETVGQEEVLGIETTHLRGELTLRQSLDQIPADAAEELRQAYERFGIPDEALDESMSYDVWIDGDGLVRQLRQSFDIGAVLGQGDAPSSFEIRFVEFGVDADIEIPTDFVDATDLPGFPG